MRAKTLTALLALTVWAILPAIVDADDYEEAEVIFKCTDELTIYNGGLYPTTGNEELDAVIEELGGTYISELYDFLPEGEVEDPNGKWDNDDWDSMMDACEFDIYYHLEYAADTDPLVAAEDLEACNIVEFAEPNYLFDTEATYPDDDYFSSQWGLHNTGQFNGTPDADIDAPEAWDEWTPSFRVPVVAVVDTGVDLDHVDLEDNLVTGRNILDPGSPPNDTYGHGTHVAGIFGARTNNSTGVAAVCWNHVDIMPIKVGTGRYLNTKAITGGIIWAAQHGADVENFSFGSTHNCKAIEKACEGAYLLGVVLVAAKGNNLGSTHNYPSDYTTVIAITATDNDDNLASFSNYGENTEFCAPGEYILSTIPNDQYGFKDGTSMAAPFISGACGLIQAHYLCAVDPPVNRTASARNILKNAVDDLGSEGWDQYFGWGRLNLDLLIGEITTDGHDSGKRTTASYLPPSSAAALPIGNNSVPQEFHLYPNSPNPAVSSTSFTFDLPACEGPCHVSLKVYDLAGRRVASVIEENLAPGHYTRQWNCAEENGGRIAAGVYLYRLTAGSKAATGKVVITR